MPTVGERKLESHFPVRAGRAAAGVATAHRTSSSDGGETQKGGRSESAVHSYVVCKTDLMMDSRQMKQGNKTNRKLALLVRVVVVDWFVCEGRKALEVDETIFICFVLSPAYLERYSQMCISAT